MLGITGEGRVFIASEKSNTEERLDEINEIPKNQMFSPEPDNTKKETQ